jgi:hypothetical protein
MSLLGHLPSHSKLGKPRRGRLFRNAPLSSEFACLFACQLTHTTARHNKTPPSKRFLAHQVFGGTDTQVFWICRESPGVMSGNPRRSSSWMVELCMLSFSPFRTFVVCVCPPTHPSKPGPAQPNKAPLCQTSPGRTGDKRAWYRSTLHSSDDDSALSRRNSVTPQPVPTTALRTAPSPCLLIEAIIYLRPFLRVCHGQQQQMPSSCLTPLHGANLQALLKVTASGLHVLCLSGARAGKKRCTQVTLIAYVLFCCKNETILGLHSSSCFVEQPSLGPVRFPWTG